MKQFITLFLSVCMLSAACAQKKDASGTIIHLDKETFITKVVNYEKSTEWKYLGDKPCIIDFYADWCGPCRMLTPTLEALAKDYAGKLYVYKINVDEQRELAALFNAQSIPLLIFVPMKGSPAKSVGLRQREDIEQTIKTLLLPQADAQSGK